MTMYIPSSGVDLVDVILGGGYNTPSADFSNPWLIIPGQAPIYIPIGRVNNTPTTGTVTVITTNPAQNSIITSPEYVPTAMEIAKLMGSGWDTTARSINPFNSYLRFTVGAISGACMMIGSAGMDGLAISQFTHGLAIDITGVHVYESGVFKFSLRSVPSFDSEFRIYRQTDNSIVYAVITGTETIVYHSTTPTPVPEFISLYAYGYLYSSGDQITDASFADGEVLSTGTVTMSGTGFLQAGTCKAFLEGIGSLTYQKTMAVCSGNGTLYAKSSSDYIRAIFPHFGCQMFESVDAYGAINTTFPILTAYLEEFAFVPTTPEFIFTLFPALVCSMTTTTIGMGEIDTTFPMFVGRMFEEEAYGELSATFRVRWGMMLEGPPTGTKYLIETVYAFDASKMQIDHIVFVNNVGTIIDTITATRIAIAGILEQLTVSDSYTVIGTFIAPFMSTVTVSDTMLVGAMLPDSMEAAILDKTARVWVVNIDTGASSQYDNYGYTSFYTHEGKNYGVAEDGIYELSGDSDNGTPIDALVDFGRSDLGSIHKKKVTSAYLDVGSNGKLLLLADADGQSYAFEANNSSPIITKQRVNMGSMLSGYYWNFILTNNDGYNFDLESIMFEIMQLNRRL